jgi:hypothetical protein
MKLHRSGNIRWYALVGGLVATLALLVVLQYRSVKAVGVTMREQMRMNLRGSLMDVRQAFEREFRPLCRELELGASPKGDLHEVAVRFNNWQAVAMHPSLVAAVYVWEPKRNSASEFVTSRVHKESRFEAVRQLLPVGCGSTQEVRGALARS